MGDEKKEERVMISERSSVIGRVRNRFIYEFICINFDIKLTRKAKKGCV